MVFILHRRKNHLHMKSKHTYFLLVLIILQKEEDMKNTNSKLTTFLTDIRHLTKSISTGPNCFYFM